MKRIFSILLLAVLAASCTTFASPGPTATPQPTATFTPTLTPTITPTPTETPDPNMPPDATGRNATTGQYTKTVQEEGETVLYVWKQLQPAAGGNAPSGAWFRSWMADGPIDMTGYGENCYKKTWGAGLSLELEVFVAEGLHDLDQIGYIYHPAGESDFAKMGGVCDALPSRIVMDLFMNFYHLMPDPPSTSYREKHKKSWERYHNGPGMQMSDYDREKWVRDWRAFGAALENDEVKVRFGHDLWQPSRGYAVYWIDEAIAEKDPSMHLSVQAYTVKNYYWKIAVEDGKLIILLAPSTWLKAELASRDITSRERTMRMMLLYPLEAIIHGEQPEKEDLSFLSYQFYSGQSGPGTTVRTPTKTFTITTSFIAFMPEP